MKDDTLIMQNGEADGNIIMDGNNLIFKEGSKDSNHPFKFFFKFEILQKKIHNEKDSSKKFYFLIEKDDCH